MPTPTIWHLPYPRNPFFTGREDVLSHLHNTLQADARVALSHPQGITGLGGIGKTQTALEYAYRYQTEYDAVFWVRADSLTTLISSLVELARVLELPERSEQDQELIVQAVLLWLRGNTKWLLIYDNIDDLSIADPFLPKAGSGHLLFTTRAYALEGIAQRLDIRQMDPEIGALLLLRRSSLLALQATLDMANPDDQSIARAISQELDGLPLALDQAGAYIKEAPCPLPDYLALYRTRRSDILRVRGHFNQGYPESVATTWSLAFEKVREANAAAAELLCFGAYLAPDAIPESIIQGASATFLSPWVNSSLGSIATNPLAFDRSMQTLLRYSLVTRQVDKSLFSIHRLVQTVIQDAATDSEKDEYLNMKVIPAIRDTFPDPENVHQWRTCEQYIPHVLVCAAWIVQKELFFDSIAEFLDQAGVYVQKQGRYREAEQLYKISLEIWKDCGNDIGIAITLNRLGMIYQAQGNYQQAEASYQQAQTTLQAQSEDASSVMAAISSNLAELHRERGNYQQAEAFYQQTPVQQKELLAEPNLDSAINLNNLGILYTNQGKYREAEASYLQALTLYKTLLGDKHPDVANSLNNLAGVYSLLGQDAEAESFYQQALTIMEQHFEADHPTIALNLNNLGELYRKQGQYDKAEDYFLRALTIREKQPGNPFRALSLNGLGALYAEQGQYEKGETVLQQALTIQEQYLGSDHPDLATTLNNLGLCYQQQGRLAEAEASYTRALAMRKRLLEENHPALAWSLNNLASLYQAQKKYAEAERFYLQALEIRERRLGPHHRDIAQTLNNLGEVYRVRGKYRKAQQMFIRAINIYIQPEQPLHPGLAKASNNLALLCHTLKKYTQALQFYQYSLAVTEKMMGDNHPDLVPALSNLAHLYTTLGKRNLAEALYQRAIAICEEHLDTEHPYTQLVRESYASLSQTSPDSGKPGIWQRLLSRISS
jgi:tetratricopeptide (TPR) repeat protein